MTRGTKGLARAGALALVAALAGCANLQTETRVERGPSLRTFDREGPATPGGVEVTASAQWPKLALGLATYDVCKNEKVEEYVEERITETTAPAAGPALGTGVPLTLVGAGLLATQGLFSNKPDTRFIDATGRYGPTPRQVATGWGTVLLVVGVPALATALIELAQTGEKTEQRKVESVVSAMETHCHVKPAAGALTLQGGQAVTQPLMDGKVELTPQAALSLDTSRLALDGREVDLTPEAQAQVEQFRACARSVPAPGPEALAALKSEVVAERLEDAISCEKVPGAPAAEARAAYEKELQARRERGEATGGPPVKSWDEAVAALKPELRFEPGSPDTEKLDAPDRLVGQAALMRGLLRAWVEPNIAAVDIGARRVWVFLERDRKQLGDLEGGMRVEGVVVVAGHQTLGEVELPLLRAVWLRPAM